MQPGRQPAIIPPKGFKPLEKRDSYETRRHRRTLSRRQEFLASRIAQLKSEHADPSAMTYDQAEYKALSWTLGLIENWIADDPLFDYDLSGTEMAETFSVEEIADLLGTEAFYKGESVEIVDAKLIEVSVFPQPGDRRTIRLTLRRRTQDEKDCKDQSRPLRHRHGTHHFFGEPA